MGSRAAPGSPKGTVRPAGRPKMGIDTYGLHAFSGIECIPYVSMLIFGGPARRAQDGHRRAAVGATRGVRLEDRNDGSRSSRTARLGPAASLLGLA